MTNSSKTTYYACPRCHIGQCLPIKTTFVCVYDGMLVSAPDTPAHLCDVCGFQEFDYDSIMALEALFDGDDLLDEHFSMTIAMTREKNRSNKRPKI